MPKNETRTFEELLIELSKIPDNSKRAIIEKNGEYAIRYSQIKTTKDSIQGDVLKIRLKELPVKASLAGPQTPIPLNQDEGIGEETVYLYDKQLNILVFQFNSNSIRAGKFIDYIESHCKVNGHITLLPVLKGDAHKRMLNMAEPAKLEIAVAELSNPVFLHSEINSVKDLVRANEAIKSPVMNITYSLGHNKPEKGYFENILKAAKDLLRFKSEGGSVTKLKISGKIDAESGTEALDLLLDRMISEVQIVTPFSAIPIEIRFAKTNEVWLTARPELASMFKNDD